MHSFPPRITTFVFICMSTIVHLKAAGSGQSHLYELWEPAPAPNRGPTFVEEQKREFPYD